jgi:GNAT superfamily N-acetyltransferase
MNLAFEAATNSDAFELAALHRATAEKLTREFGEGQWSAAPSEQGVLSDLRRPEFGRILVARTSGRRIAGTLRLATKKPWAIDTAYFSRAARPLYLTAMAVHPDFQRQGIGRMLLQEAEAVARAWPGDAIRLDAYDAAAGAGPFYLKCGFREVGRARYKGNPLVYFEMALPDPGHTA